MGGKETNCVRRTGKQIAWAARGNKLRGQHRKKCVVLGTQKTKVPYSHNYISRKMRHNDHTDDEVPSHS